MDIPEAVPPGVPAKEPPYANSCNITAVAKCCKQLCKEKHHHKHRHPPPKPHYYGYENRNQYLLHGQKPRGFIPHAGEGSYYKAAEYKPPPPAKKKVQQRKAYIEGPYAQAQ
jgi:hypothetical protein